jgi:arylsulfatase A-like enzyme
MSWPARLPAGKLFEPPVITLDLLATFTAAAGRVVTTEDSVDLLPFLEGKRSGSPHDFLYWRAGPTVAIRDDRYKLIRYNRTHHREAELGETGRLPPPEEGWGTGSPLGQVTLLYDMTADPAESTNLAKDHPDVVARLEQRLAAWVETLAAPILPPVRSSIREVDGEWVQMFF